MSTGPYGHNESQFTGYFDMLISFKVMLNFTPYFNMTINNCDQGMYPNALL